jgi:hypothetical protein
VGPNSMRRTYLPCIHTNAGRTAKVGQVYPGLFVVEGDVFQGPPGDQLPENEPLSARPRKTGPANELITSIARCSVGAATESWVRRVKACH